MRWLPYGVAILSVALALGITLSLGSWISATPAQLFFVAVMVSAWYGGLGPGLLATALSTLAVNYFLIEPYGSLSITNLRTVVQTGVFVMAALLISGLNQSRHMALRQARANLSERQQTEAALQESTAILNVINQTSPTLIFVKDRQGRVLMANPATLQAIGQREAEIIGKTDAEFHVNREEGEQMMANDRWVMQTGQVQVFEEILEVAAGRRTFLSTKSPYRDPQGNIIGLIGVAFDVTERQQAEAALQESEVRFRQMAETIDDVFWLFDPQSQQMLYISPAYEQIWGRSCESLCKDVSQWIETIHSDDRAQVQTAVSQCITKGSHEVEYRVVRPDGSIRWVRDRGYLIRDEQGQPDRITGVAQDITERKQAESALRESDRRFKSVFNQQFQYIAILTPEGRIIDVNAAPLAATGVAREEVIGQLFWETPWWAPLPEMQAVWSAQVAQVGQGGVPVMGETYYATGDGSLRFSRYVLSAVKDEADQVVNLIVQAEDLTERKRLEETLHRLVECARLQDGEFFRALVRALAVALDVRYAFICQVNPDNPQQARTIAGWADGAWIESFEYSLAGAPCEQVVQNQTCFYRSGVTRLFPQDQFLVDLGIESYLGAPLQAADGRILGLLNALHDRPIDETRQPEALIQIFADQAAAELERQQAEAAIRASEERLRSFVEANVVGILFGDVYGGVRQANDALLRMVGYTREDLQAGRLRWDTITPPEYLPLDQQHITEAQATGACTPYEKEYIRKDGSRVPVLVGYSLIGAAREESIALILDLSSRKQAEVTLRQSEARYRYLVELIPQLVWSADAEGLLLDVNQRWLDFTGVTLAQVQQEGWQAIVHPEDLPMLSQQWAAAQHTGTPYQAEGRICRADGAYRWHLHQALPLKNEQGQVMQWFGTATDMNDQKQLEQQRDRLLHQEQAARESAEAANRIKDEFLAVLSHELRSPLNPILGWAKLLQTQKLDETKTRQALQTIERNAKLQTQLIEDLLDVSRILQGKLNLNMAPVKLAATIEAAMETVRLAADAKTMQIQTELDASVEPVLGDAGRLQQVIWNLLSNAVKFTPAGGQVKIQLERVDAQVQITVSDTGKGISADFLPHVFDYFRQEDGKTTRQFGGLGLGLAIVRHLTELHGGSVGVESPGEGLGATFTVRLPLMQTEGGRIKDEDGLDSSLISHASSLPLAGLRILMVDDEDDMRDLMVTVLEQAGATVRATASAAEALVAFDRVQPHLLISDIGMPDVDGYMLMRQVRALPPEQGGQVPAIALTAYAGEIDQQQALAAGFQTHVSKPVEPAEIVAIVARLCERNSFTEEGGT